MSAPTTTQRHSAPPLGWLQTLRTAWDRVPVQAFALVPLLFALPILAGIIATLIQLVGTPEPFVGYDTVSTDVDAKAVYLGQALYADPASSYSGLPYTPLFALLIGGLDHLALWSGWGIVVTMFAGFALAGLAGLLAYRPTSASLTARIAAALAAVGLGAIAWWLVEWVPFNFLYTARNDQLAWAFALFGLVLMPFVANGSRRAAAAALLLLSAAFLTKQPVAVAGGVAVLWLLLAAAAGRTRWRSALAFGAGLLALNGAVLALLNVLSGGWASFFIFEVPSREARTQGLLQSAKELVTSVPAGLGLVGLLALALVAQRLMSREGNESGERRRPLGALRAIWLGSRDAQIASVLGLFVVVGSATAIYANLKQGSVHNQFIGVAWALAFLVALAYGYCLQHRSTAFVGAVALLALVPMGHSNRAQATANRLSLHPPDAYLHAFWFPVSAALRDFALRHTVYHPIYSDLNILTERRVYPNHVNIQDLLASGNQPGYLVRLLLDRHFDYVFPFSTRPNFKAYAYGHGKWEENYLWKLDRVIRARYEPAPEAPRLVRISRLLPSFQYISPGLRKRRPGPERAVWMRHCFAPFRISGVQWRIGKGGGFWCRPGGTGPKLELVDTPAPVSEIRATEPTAGARGRLGIALPGGNDFFEVACGRGNDGWRVRGTPGSGSDLDAQVFDGGREVSRTTLAGRPSGPGSARRITLLLDRSQGTHASVRSVGPGRAALRMPPQRCSSLSLRGSRRSRVSFDVGGLRLG